MATPEIVIFFLAHAGIAQMMTWVSWFLSAPPGSVAFRVFCDPGVMLARPYFARLPFFFSTTWGSAQVVYAIRDGYRCILDEFPSVKMIFLVSGHCIPIASPLRAIEIAKGGISYVAHTVSNRGTYVVRDSLPPLNSKILKALGLAIQPKRLSVSWIHVSNADARKIIAFPFWKLLEIQAQYERSGICPNPDEFWLCYILSDSRTLSENLTEQDRLNDQDASPIMWKPGDKYVIEGRLKTLEDVVKESQEGGALFYRKVHAGVKL